MQAKHIRAGVHSVGGKNIASVHRYGNTVGVNFTDGSTKRYHANTIVFVQPQRDKDGKFLPREYVLATVIDGVDMVWSVTGRAALRNLKRTLRGLTDSPAITYAI